MNSVQRPSSQFAALHGRGCSVLGASGSGGGWYPPLSEMRTSETRISRVGISERSQWICLARFNNVVEHRESDGCMAPDNDIPEENHDAIVVNLLSACVGGEHASLSRLLDPSVILVVDSGGKVRAPTEPVVGAQQAAQFLLDLATAPDMLVRAQSVSGQTGLVFDHKNRVIGVLGLKAAFGRIQEIWIVVNPEKLVRWNP